LAHLLLAQSYALRAGHADAIAEAQRGIDLAGVVTPLAQATLGTTFVAMARRGDAVVLRDDLASLARRADVSPFYEATVRAALGEVRAAIALLEQMVARHDPWTLALRVHPWLDPLRRDAAFAELIRRIGE
jgi:hypothetical protein